MTLRLAPDELRLRLSQEECEHLKFHGRISSTLTLSPHYKVEFSFVIDNPSLSFSENQISIGLHRASLENPTREPVATFQFSEPPNTVVIEVDVFGSHPKKKT